MGYEKKSVMRKREINECGRCSHIKKEKEEKIWARSKLPHPTIVVNRVKKSKIGNGKNWFVRWS